jgi:hypothetical protein
VSRHLRILLINTNKPRNTKDLVGKVRQKHDAYPSVVKLILEAIGEVGQVFLNTLADMEKDVGKEETHYK